MKSHSFIFIFCASVFFFFIYKPSPRPIKVGSVPPSRLAGGPTNPHHTHRSTRTIASSHRPPAPSLPTEIKEKNTHPEIMKLLRENDACGLYALIASDMVSRQALVDVFIDYTQQEELRNLIGSEGVLYKNAAANTEQEKFFQAAALGDLTYRRDGQIEANPEKALAAMEELQRLHPNNGAYPFFLMILQEKMGKPAAHLRETLKHLQNSKEYELFILPIQQQIHSHSWDSAAMRILTSYTEGMVPGFNVYAGTQIVSGIGDEKDREHLAELLTRQARNATKHYRSYGFDPSLYSLGAELVPGKYLNFYEFAQTKSPPNEEVLVDDPGINLEACDQTPLDEYIKTYRGSY
jgi:hypothetical protein